MGQFPNNQHTKTYQSIQKLKTHKVDILVTKNILQTSGAYSSFHNNRKWLNSDLTESYSVMDLALKPVWYIHDTYLHIHCIFFTLITFFSLQNPRFNLQFHGENPRFSQSRREKMQRKGSNQRLSSSSSNKLLRSRISFLMLSMFATIASFYVAGRFVTSLFLCLFFFLR